MNTKNYISHEIIRKVERLFKEDHQEHQNYKNKKKNFFLKSKSYVVMYGMHGM